MRSKSNESPRSSFIVCLFLFSVFCLNQMMMITKSNIIELLSLSPPSPPYIRCRALNTYEMMMMAIIFSRDFFFFFIMLNIVWSDDPDRNPNSDPSIDHHQGSSGSISSSSSSSGPTAVSKSASSSSSISSPHLHPDSSSLPSSSSYRSSSVTPGTLSPTGSSLGSLNSAQNLQTTSGESVRPIWPQFEDKNQQYLMIGEQFLLHDLQYILLYNSLLLLFGRNI